MSKLPSEKASNRLQHEQSPYLLQHAHNPVDWFAWGEEAFEVARSQDKPIFLSIGYATCHWCHVMERESFEDAEVAQLMNEAFVCIKVDREERPDIDGIYMSVCQMMNGNGGWPLTVFLTPDKKPFFAATYIPKYTQTHRLGMLDLVPAVAESWHIERRKIVDTAQHLVGLLQENVTQSEGIQTALSQIDGAKALQQLAARFDKQHGGFGHAPKFPSPHNLMFLLREAHRNRDAATLQMVEITLQKMRLGGIFDQVGFGFHRYATDPSWFLPHFEKMLYDQALLMMAYTEAFQATKKPEYAQTVREIATYVLRDMTDPQGGFYSAEDADSEGEEGKFYTWTIDELTMGELTMDELLQIESADRKSLLTYFNATNEGNAYDEATHESTGVNILHLDEALPDGLKHAWESYRRALFERRKNRIHPLKDDKVLTDWNGLMIAALAKAGRALREPKYVEAARKAADFLLATMCDSQARLLHRWRQGHAGLQANLDDYAFLVWGLTELYQATFEARYLQKALELTEFQLVHFWDNEGGGFFFTPDDGEALIFREKPLYDGAAPSGNAVSLFNLTRLSRLASRPDFSAKAEAMRRTFAAEIRQHPSGYTFFLMAVEALEAEGQELVLAGDLQSDAMNEMRRLADEDFLPHLLVLHADPDMVNILPFLKDYKALEEKPTAYLCQNFSCDLPTNRIEELKNSLRKS
jgi:uncharacterized protein YyaL (SSP411 family)